MRLSQLFHLTSMVLLTILLIPPTTTAIPTIRSPPRKRETPSHVRKAQGDIHIPNSPAQSMSSSRKKRKGGGSMISIKFLNNISRQSSIASRKHVSSPTPSSADYSSVSSVSSLSSNDLSSISPTEATIPARNPQRRLSEDPLYPSFNPPPSPVMRPRTTTLPTHGPRPTTALPTGWEMYIGRPDALEKHFTDNVLATLDERTPLEGKLPILDADINLMGSLAGSEWQKYVGSLLPWSYATLLVEVLKLRLGKKTITEPQAYNIVSALVHARFSLCTPSECKGDRVYFRMKDQLIFRALMPILRAIDAPIDPLFMSADMVLRTIDGALKARSKGHPYPPKLTTSIFVEVMKIIEEATYPEITKKLNQKVRTLYNLLSPEVKSQADAAMRLHTPIGLSLFGLDE